VTHSARPRPRQRAIVPLDLPRSAPAPHARHRHDRQWQEKFFEHCILQDIAARRGVCVIDPHGNHPGSLYRSLLSWLATSGKDESIAPVHLIDPNARSHKVGFNPLAIPRGVDPSVIGATALEAFERAWGDEDTNTKPTLQRVLFGTFVALAEAGLTLAEARLLFDRKDAGGVRAHVLKSVSNQDARDLLVRLGELSSSQTMFDAEVIAPRNRISKLTRNPALRAIVGRQHARFRASAR
jgi:hypothetical protein